jgi:tetratricopeptide (TPR) repeat protein
LTLGLTHYDSRNPVEALKECEEAFKAIRDNDLLKTERLYLHLKGLALLEMKSIEEAQRTANELKMLIKGGLNEGIIIFYYHLAGLIELERMNYPQAIKLLRKAVFPESISPSNRILLSARSINSLATAYFESGNLKKAQEEYERITRLTTGKLFYGDIYAKSFLMLGKIYEQTGQKAKAIENYEKFLDLWKDADPGIGEVDDARERLAGLKE